MLDPALVTIAAAPPTGADADHILWCYYAEVTSRYYRRPTTAREIHDALSQHAREDFAPPHGLFLLARAGATVVGCAGARWLPDGGGQVERVYIDPLARRHGLGRRLLTAVEDAARARGAHRLIAHTRTELVEARHLLTGHGYRDLELATTDPGSGHAAYSEHWLTKILS